ncbi:hypothetical protein DPMN_106610 [Dreissena polymorpha]|uniref:Uncharacterized protein n=1 Tax=Dreissena polymorpha TaxID=45954 RepID=A0A9D4K5G5_DREPO|nr:hypothetical protein DPMN_106610 [Dreissena polymorpha]
MTGAPGLVMWPCIVEIDRIVIENKDNFWWAWPMWAGRPRLDRIVISEVQYQFEVIVKGNFGWAWPMWVGRPDLVMGPCIVEINYQLEVNRCRNEEIIVKDNFGWGVAYVGGAPQVELDRIVISEVQYQFEVKGNFWVGVAYWAGSPRFGNGPCIVEINRIVIREVQYQFEVNRLKGNFGWAWPMWEGRPRIDRIVIREVQYQFEVNRCRNEEIIVKGNFVWGVAYVGGAPQVEINCIVIREFQGSSVLNSVGDNHNIPTLFKKRGDKEG